MVIDHDIAPGLGKDKPGDRCIRRAEQHGLRTAKLVVGVAFEPDGVEDRADDVKALRVRRADSMILWVVSRRISLTGSAVKGLRVASMLRALPAANAPVWRSALICAGPDLKSIFAVS